MPCPGTATEQEWRAAQRLIADLRAEVELWVDAVIWMSAADDFQVGGRARAGYERSVAPLLAAVGHERLHRLVVALRSQSYAIRVRRPDRIEIAGPGGESVVRLAEGHYLVDERWRSTRPRPSSTTWRAAPWRWG